MSLLSAVVSVVFITYVQYASAATIVFQANPTAIHPVLTKSLKLRCALEKEVDTNVAFRQRAITAAEATTITASTTPTSAHTTAPTAHGSSTHPRFNETTSPHPSTSHRPIISQADVSHIMSILVSRQDRVTGRLQTVARVSPYDPPSASVDLDNIKVTGSTDASPISREIGYLEVTWEYPAEAQSGEYFCDIYGLDTTLHPMSLSSSAWITAIQATVQDLAWFVAQNQRHVTELQQSLANVTAQLSRLQNESQEQIQAFNDSIDSLQNTTQHMKAQNIQTGAISCSNVQVKFPRPYERNPTVFVSILDFHPAGANYNWNLGVTIQSLSTTGFNPVCSSSQITSNSIIWIAIDN